MSHRSWCAEAPGEVSNERLEFLGDAVLGAIVAEHVFRRWPELPEGQLTDARKAVVNAVTLADVARELSVGDVLLLGKGEAQAGGAEKTSILADALEAVIAAVYLDGGWGAAEALVLRLLAERVVGAVEGVSGLDHKSLLQELVGRRFESVPRYEVTDEGPDHAKRFFATVLVGGEPSGRGEGRSKKQAEQAAARVAWEMLTAADGVGVGDA